MPSKKRKYNARFPAGRIKKIMQTDEEVGKVAQAVPIIISRTLELFVESLLSKAIQVTMSRNAKTLSPSHVKQCILSESRFDFLRDLVKNIPDVSVAEEKEMMSAENSPNSSRFQDASVQRKEEKIREDSNSSSGSDVKVTPLTHLPRENRRSLPAELDLSKTHRLDLPATIVSNDAVIDLSKKSDEETKPIRTANFYQETLIEESPHKSVITVNPSYHSPQPSTSSYLNLRPVDPLIKFELPIPKQDLYLDVRLNNNKPTTPVNTPTTPGTPITPLVNIDFTKNISRPQIKVLDTAVTGVKNETIKNLQKHLSRQNSKSKKEYEHKNEKMYIKPNLYQAPPVNIDHLNSGNLQIDEDYDT